MKGGDATLRALLEPIRRRLGLKLFLSHLIVALTTVIILDTTVEFQAPILLVRDTAQWQTLLAGHPALAADLEANFQVATNKILVLGTLFALLVASAASLFTTRRVVRPIQAMMQASARIATGDYHERVQILGDDELGAMGVAFNRMAETLQRTEQHRVELLGNLAHELRTPLSSINNLMEGLADGVLPTEPGTFLSVQREIARLQRLIFDLEELSHAEAGRIPLDLRPVSLPDLIRATAERLHPQFDDKDVRLCLELPSDLPLVPLDPARITQVLLNLLGNALQYTPPGGHVTVRVWRAGYNMVLCVQDNGIGISAEHLPHLFERFYRVDKSRSRVGGGSGIGLTIAKHLIGAHQGRIWAESAGVGAGSTFTCILPSPPYGPS